MTHLLFLAGSARAGSFNKKLAKQATALAEKQGVTAEFIDLADYDMPLFCEDWEAENGLPTSAKKLKAKFQDSDGYFMACPEYNGFISPLLKNTIDWLTRSHEEGEAPLSAFKGKIAAISSASPGGLGGLRGLVTVRMLLGNIGVHVIPSQVAVGAAHEAFDGDTLSNEGQLKMLQGVIDEFVTTAKALG